MWFSCKENDFAPGKSLEFFFLRRWDRLLSIPTFQLCSAHSTKRIFHLTIMLLSLFQNVINLKRLKGMVPKWIYIKLHRMAGLVTFLTWLLNAIGRNENESCHGARWSGWVWLSFLEIRLQPPCLQSSKLVFPDRINFKVAIN